MINSTKIRKVVLVVKVNSIEIRKVTLIDITELKLSETNDFCYFEK